MSTCEDVGKIIIHWQLVFESRRARLLQRPHTSSLRKVYISVSQWDSHASIEEAKAVFWKIRSFQTSCAEVL